MSELADRRVPESQFANVSSKPFQPAESRRVTRISCVTRAEQQRSIARTRALLNNGNVPR